MIKEIFKEKEVRKISIDCGMDIENFHDVLLNKCHAEILKISGGKK